MSYLRTHLDKHTIQTICDSIRKEILDKLQKFDYTAFEYFKPEDQTTIQSINVDVRNDVLTLSRMLKFDYIESDPIFNRTSKYSMRQIYVDFTMRVLPTSGKVTSVTITLSMDGQISPADVAFGLYVGGEKYLINSEFFERATFEGYVFQQSTVDKPEPFGLDYVLEIIQKLKV